MLVEVCAAGCPKSVGGEMVLVPVVVPVVGAPKILEGGLFPNSGFDDEVDVPKSPLPCAGVVVAVLPKRLAAGCVVAFEAPKSPPAEGCCCGLVGCDVPPNILPDVAGCVTVLPKIFPPVIAAGCALPPNKLVEVAFPKTPPPVVCGC